MDLLVPVITWLTIGYLCQFSVYPFLVRILPTTVAYATSKALGIISFGYIVWILGLITSASTSLIAILTLITISIAAYLFTLKEHSRVDWIPIPVRSDIYWVEFLYLISFLFFLLVYSTHPEIYWGEKPMDFSFLNYFTRLESLPPSDPWASGNSLGYYYLGTYIIAIFHKLSGIAPNFGFGIALSQVFALLVVTTSSVFIRLGLPSKISSIFAITAITAANYDVLYLWLIKQQRLGFDLYWASSRTLTSPGMNEYPLWSMLFADLHAHVIALPFVCVAIVLGLNFVTSLITSDFYRIREKLLWLGFIWGTLCSLNTWDYLGFGVVIGLSVFAIVLECCQDSLPRAMKVGLLGLLLLVVSIIFSIPFHLTVISGTKANWGFVYPEEFNTIGQIFRIHGHWILLITISFIAFASSKIIAISKSGIIRLIATVLVSIIPIAVGLVTKNLANVPDAPWGILAVATLLCTIGAHSFFYYEKVSIRCIGLLAIAAGTIYTLSECFYLMDRMNTTFKTYHLIWSLLAIAGLSYTYESLLSVMYSRKSFNAFSALSIAVIVPSLLSALLCIWMMATFYRIPSSRPSLNGTKYLASFNPVEQKAFEWINRNVMGTPTIVEAFGPSYQEYSRFSMHTGLPLILGWEYHVQQRGTKDSSIRKEDIRKIYTSDTISERMQALNKYQTQLIIVGSREREIYGLDVDNFFANNPEYFTAVFENSADNKLVKIYRHKYTNIKLNS